MRGRVIGRFRQLDGEIVRCDVGFGSEESHPRLKEGRARVVTSRSWAEESTVDRGEREQEAHDLPREL